MSVVALAHHVEIEPEAMHVERAGTRQRQAPAGRMRGVVDIEWRSPLRLRDGTPSISNDSTSGIDTARFSPSILNSIGLNATPRKSLVRFWRIIPGGPPASPATIAASAARCASSARSSTTPANTQLPSAMILPERITSAKQSPDRSVPPRCPLSIRKISAAVQWSYVTSA